MMTDATEYFRSWHKAKANCSKRT